MGIIGMELRTFTRIIPEWGHLEVLLLKVGAELTTLRNVSRSIEIFCPLPSGCLHARLQKVTYSSHSYQLMFFMGGGASALRAPVDV